MLFVKFTDSAYDDDNKTIALIIAQHSGMEISGMNSILSLSNYPVLGSKSAKEILTRHMLM